MNRTSLFFVVALAIASVVCVVTAVRIEYLNHLAGGAIQTKAKYEPNSKWRGGDGYLKARQQVEAEWRGENGLSPDTKLSPNDWETIRARMKAKGWSPSPRDRLGEVL